MVAFTPLLISSLHVPTEHFEAQSVTPFLKASCLESISEEFQENNSSVDTSPHHTSHFITSPPPSTAITTSSNENNNEAILNPSVLTLSDTSFNTSGEDSGKRHINSSLSTNYLDIGCDTPPLPEPADAEVMQHAAEINTRQTLEVTSMTEANSERVQTLKAVFDGDRNFQTGTRTLVRRSKSEGQVKALNKANRVSAVPEVVTDATLNDKLWSKLDPSSHRDSVSSSSSISSNDTVIDLSLPNLSRKSLTCLAAARDCSDNKASIANWSVKHRSSATAVSKSKSNPNLRDGEMCTPEDELQPRPLATEKGAGRLMQRRHTWSRLYMEGLKQSSALAAASSKRPSTPLAKDTDSGSKSKSLGDLTSDDIVCNFESKYRSISRSFIVRPSRQRGKAQRQAQQNDLTEQLKILTDVEPLSSKDFQSKSDAEEVQEEEEMPCLRRSSSRSQSRVRYIANRARQAQERQRLQSLISGSGSPIEERGNPEGACSVPYSPCASLDLLSQLPPGPPQRSPLSPDNDVFFTLRL